MEIVAINININETGTETDAKSGFSEKMSGNALS